MSAGPPLSNTHTPPWPSLYNPFIELLDVAHLNPVQPGGKYLDRANDVFRFTFYWTLVFYLPLFVLSGFLAFLNIAVAPTPRRSRSNDPDAHAYDAAGPYAARPLLLTPLSPAASTADGLRPVLSRASTLPRRTPPKVNPHSTRAAYALLVLLVFLAAGLLGAAVGSAVIGYVLAALYKAGEFHMTTWMPPIFALVQTLIGILGLYSSIVEIM